MKYTPTDEQKEIIAEISNGDGRIILANSKAGTGKSSTARLAVNTIRPKRGLYTAFNKAIVEEGKDLFPTNIECRTLHSLALSYVQPKLPIEPFTYLCIKERLNYPAKSKVIKAIDEFYRSSSVDVYEFMETELGDPRLRTIAINYTEKMFNDEMPVTFNYLLKHFHLLLHEGLIDPNYDMVILDECQDSTAVALEIFKLLKTNYKLGLGDQFQAIYGFMNLVDGFEVLKDDAIILGLTKSFRCSIPIAKRVETYGKELLDENFTFEGTENPEEDGLTAYITATNAGIIKRLVNLHSQNRGYVLTRPLKDIFACPLALTTARQGKKVLHKQYKFLDREYTNYTMSKYKNFFKYLKEEIKDEEINNSINLLNGLAAKDISIFKVLADAKTIKKDHKTLVSTGHSCKGLGFETVHIEDDLNAMVAKAIKAKEEGNMTEGDYTALKLGYVSSTRCRINLINCDYL